MTQESFPVLEFPAMLHGPSPTVLRKVKAEGRGWAREYLKTGAFTEPQRMLQVQPGDVLVVGSCAEFDLNYPRWWMHMFVGVFMYLDDGVPREEHQRMRDAFESFCLSTPWGSLYQVTSPSPLRSAQRMASRLAAVLRFWDILRGPRYAFRFGKKYTLEELVEDIYRETLEAWCPGGPASIREHLAITVERMSRATREDCMEAVLRVMPVLAKGDPDLKHHEVLGDSGFLRERLQTLPSRRFEDISSAYSFTVFAQLAAWDRELDRH